MHHGILNFSRIAIKYKKRKTTRSTNQVTKNPKRTRIAAAAAAAAAIAMKKVVHQIILKRQYMIYVPNACLNDNN